MNITRETFSVFADDALAQTVPHLHESLRQQIAGLTVQTGDCLVFERKVYDTITEFLSHLHLGIGEGTAIGLLCPGVAESLAADGELKSTEYDLLLQVKSYDSLLGIIVVFARIDDQTILAHPFFAQFEQGRVRGIDPDTVTRLRTTFDLLLQTIPVMAARPELMAV